MRISDWSSDVCSSDLPGIREGRRTVELFALEANIGDDVFLARIEDCFRLQFVKLARDRGHALDRTLLRTGGYLPFLLGRHGLAAIEPLPQPALGTVEVVAGISRSEEHTSELQSLMRTSYAVFSLKQKTQSI